MVEGETAEIAARLRAVHLFRGASEAELAASAALFSRVDFPAGTAVFQEGDQGGDFYIVDQGRLDVTRQPGGRKVGQDKLTVLEAGDYFGAGAMLTGRRRSATVTALTDVRLFRTDEAGFDRLLALVKGIKPRLALTDRTYRMIRGRTFDWLEPDEIILIYAKKHWFVLLQQIIKPIAVMLLALVILLAVGLFLQLWLWAVWGVVLAPLLGWAVFVFVDWANDYYVVTNRRVLHEERILLIYESRVGAPLYTLRNVQVTRDPLMRALDYGNVVLQTFAGAITFSGVGDPQALADLALEMVARERERQALTERKAIRDELLKQMGLASRLATGASLASPTPVPLKPPRPAFSLRGLWRGIVNLFSLETRVEARGVITYRKHPWVLLVEAAVPITVLSVLGVLTLVRVVGEFTGWLQLVPLNTLVCGIGFALALPFLGWLIYRYEDWRNDIYQITADSIYDIERKPFIGTEERRQAPLDALLNVQVNRPSFMANLLNYGNVIVQTGGKTGELTFDHVFDPLSIQQDLWRRYEQLQTRKREGEAARRRAEMAVWFAEFRRVLDEDAPREAAS